MSQELYHKALESGDVALLRAILTGHPDYLNSNLTWGEYSGFALHYAASQDHAEVIRFLIQEKMFDIDRTQSAGWTALHYACALGKGKAVRELLELGANPGVKGNAGRTALDVCSGDTVKKLMIAAINGSISILQLKNEKKEIVWTLASPCEVMSVRRTPDDVYRLTEIFNFENRRMTALALELRNNTLAQTVLFFDDIPDSQCLHQAYAKLLELGGHARASSIDKCSLDKPKLPRP